MIQSWNDGYFSEMQYTYGYYQELSPTYLKFILLLKGYDVFNNSNQHHCELGFGQGISLNIHAATMKSEFYGTDFNPSHAAFARDLSQYCHSITHIFDDSFEQLLHRDLPQFDSICLHGIWSWINIQNQKIIQKFIDKFLKPGGVVYISYNILPGWTPLLPIRELLYNQFTYATFGDDTPKRIYQAIELTQQTLQHSSEFNHISPDSIKQLEQLKNFDFHYVAHEYLNSDWHCLTFSKIQQQLKQSKLEFAGKVDFYAYTQFLSHTDEQLEHLNSISSTILKEDVSDFMTNNRFRRDLFIRGGIKLNPLQIQQKLDELSFILTLPRDKHNPNITGKYQHFSLDPSIYGRVLDYLASNHYEAKNFKDIREHCSELNIFVLLQIISVLSLNREVAVCQHETLRCENSAKKFNDFVFNTIKTEHKVLPLASAMIGQGLPLSYIDLVFINKFNENIHSSAQDYAEYAFQYIKLLNLNLYNRNKNIIHEDSDKIVELQHLAQDFIDKEWSLLLRAHRIVS